MVDKPIKRSDRQKLDPDSTPSQEDSTSRPSRDDRPPRRSRDQRDGKRGRSDTQERKPPVPLALRRGPKPGSKTVAAAVLEPVETDQALAEPLAQDSPPEETPPDSPEMASASA